MHLVVAARKDSVGRDEGSRVEAIIRPGGCGVGTGADAQVVDDDGGISGSGKRGHAGPKTRVVFCKWRGSFGPYDEVGRRWRHGLARCREDEAVSRRKFGDSVAAIARRIEA